MKFTFPIILFTTLLFAHKANSQVQKIKTIAGIGTGAFSGDGAASTGAELNAPLAVTVDAAGNVFILDALNMRIRKINTSGTIVTIAGNGGSGSTGDGSLGTSAELTPSGIALDKHNNLFIADALHDVIRKLAPSGIITTIAGGSGPGNSGNGGPAIAAKFASPYGLAVDTAGNIFVADGINHVVRMINAAGIVTRFAGDDTLGYTGDDFAATMAKLDSPYSVAVDYKNNVYISDMKANVIRKVTPGGIITTFAGTGYTHGYSGDGGPATAARFDRVAGISVDHIGNLFIADADNDVIRKVDTAGIITTVAGNGTPGFGGDLGPVNGCNLHTPYGIAVDQYGSIFIADANNQRVRKTYSTVSVDDVNSRTAVAVYPNPFTDKFTITGMVPTDKVSVHDIMGRTVACIVTGSAGEQQISLDAVTPGVYVLRVVDAAGLSKSVVKLIKE